MIHTRCQKNNEAATRVPELLHTCLGRAQTELLCRKKRGFTWFKPHQLWSFLQFLEEPRELGEKQFSRYCQASLDPSPTFITRVSYNRQGYALPLKLAQEEASY